MILGIKFSALQQGRQGHSKPALLSWRARPWFRTEPAVLSCNSSSYDWRWSQLRQQLWAWHRAENLRTKRFESLAKMTLMHRDAPVWHRKTFCVALHSLKITGGFVASSQDRCHWYHMKWWIWFPAWWIPWACWRQRTRGTLYHATSIIERGAGLGPRPSYFIWLDNLLFIHLSGCFSRTI